MDLVAELRLRIQIGKVIWPGYYRNQGYRDCMHLIMEYLKEKEPEQPERAIITTGGFHGEENTNGEKEMFGKDISCVVEPWLYLSGAIGAQSRDLQSKYQVYEIISVGFRLSKIQKRHHDASKTRYHYLRLDDVVEAPLERILPQVLSILTENSKSGKRTLVHCQMGVSRSVSCVIAFLMQQQYRELYPKPVPQPWLYEAAHWLVKLSRPCICPNAGFQDKLKNDTDWLLA